MGHIEQHEAQHPTYHAGSLLAQETFNLLTLAGRRFCHYVPLAPDPEGYYRTVMVVEGEPGYFDLGVTKDLGRAERDASARNQRLGLSDDDCVHIVCSSIKAQIQRERR